MNQYADIPDKSSLVRKIEEEFETNVDSGLNSGEAGRRLSENKEKYLTKEKKRLWLRSAEQECLEPLFFFLIFLSLFFTVIQARQWGWAWGFTGITAIFKARQIWQNRRLLQNRREDLFPRVQVLRDDIYQEIEERKVVVGDILRMKKGEKAPVTIKSIAKGIVYEKGEIYLEESGKTVVIALPAMDLLKKRRKISEILKGSEHLPLRAQWSAETEMIWNKYAKIVQLTEEKALSALCIFSAVLLVAAIVREEDWFVQEIFSTTCIVCGTLSIWKEALWIWWNRKR